MNRIELFVIAPWVVMGTVLGIHQIYKEGGEAQWLQRIWMALGVILWICAVRRERLGFAVAVMTMTVSGYYLFKCRLFLP